MIATAVFFIAIILFVAYSFPIRTAWEVGHGKGKKLGHKLGYVKGYGDGAREARGKMIADIRERAVGYGRESKREIWIRLSPADYSELIGEDANG